MGGMGEAKGPVLLLGVAAAAAGAPLPSQLCKNPTEPQARVFHKAAFILAAAGGRGWIVWEIMVITCLIDQSLFQAETKGSLGVLRKFGSGIDDGIGCKADDIFADQALGFLGDLIP